MNPQWGPFGEAPDERTEARKVRTIEQLMRYIATGYADSQAKEKAHLRWAS